MGYLWTTIKVKDLEESITFYTEIVGLKVQRRFAAGPGREIAFLSEAEEQTAVELIDDQDQNQVDLGIDISLGFEVDSVDQKIEFLEEKEIEIVSGPVSPNPNIEFFYVLDPNGLRIQFVENK
jgi:lactoylglutathione lyase